MKREIFYLLQSSKWKHSHPAVNVSELYHILWWIRPLFCLGFAFKSFYRSLMFGKSMFPGFFYFTPWLSLQPRLFATPWNAACQASLFIKNTRSLLKLMSIASVMPANNLTLGHPFSSYLQFFPASGSFPRSQFFASGGQSIGVSVLASVLPMNTQDWFPLGLTGWNPLQSKELSRVFSNTIVQRHQFFGAQLSLQSNSHLILLECSSVFRNLFSIYIHFLGDLI